jgi:hypothetical protein
MSVTTMPEISGAFTLNVAVTVPGIPGVINPADTPPKVEIPANGLVDPGRPA